MNLDFLINSIPASTFQVILSPDTLEKGNMLPSGNAHNRTHAFISQQSEEITGYSIAELTELPAPAFHALCIEEDIPHLEQHFKNALSTGASYHIKYRIRRSDGAVRWVQENGNFESVTPDLHLIGTVYDSSNEEVLKEELQRRENLLSAIADANSFLISEPDLYIALNKAAERVGRSTGVDRVYLFVNTLDAQGNAVTTSQRMEWNSGQAIPQLNNPDLQEVPVSEFGIFMDPLRCNKPFQSVVAELEDDFVRGFLAAQDIRSIIVLPITVHGKFWGFLGFDQCTHVRVWSHEEEQTLRTLCAAMAGAVVRNSMARDIELDLIGEKAINRGTKRLMPLIDTSEVYWTALEEIPEELGFVDCVVYEYDHHLNELKQVAARNGKLDHARILTRPFVLKNGEGIVGLAASERRNVLVTDTRNEPNYRPAGVAALSELAVPIIGDGRLFGVISATHPEANYFHARHERFLNMLSGILAVKLLQAEQFTSALTHQQMASDLQRKLNQELERSLQHREQQLEEITAISRFPEVSPLPVMRIDAAGELSYANPASAPLMKAWKLSVGQQLPKNLLVQIRWAANRKATFNQPANEKLFKVMASCVDGYDFLNVYATDETAIHELKRLQGEMIKQERMSVLGQLMAGIAHELNTPLGAISGSIRNLTRLAEGWFKNDLVNLNKDDLPIIDLHTSISDPKAADNYARQKALHTMINARYPHMGTTSKIAEMLADIGWQTPLDNDQEGLLKHPRSVQIIRTIHTIVSISNSANIIRYASERSGRIIKALRNYTHKDHGEVPMVVDLNRQIADIQQLFATGIRRGIKFSMQSNGPLLINGFEDQLSHVWTNLYHNAIQAMGGKGNLTVQIAHESQQAVIRFSNDGPMIPAELHEKIFEPMFTTKARGEGTGMGLSIAQSIVHEHGGTITCTSDKSCTTFTVLLPKYHVQEVMNGNADKE
jgi:PAS domain S-box-containing protein